jgi:hypothetical protein
MLGALEIGGWRLESGKVGITLLMSPGFSGERQQEGAAGAIDIIITRNR